MFEKLKKQVLCIINSNSKLSAMRDKIIRRPLMSVAIVLIFSCIMNIICCNCGSPSSKTVYLHEPTHSQESTHSPESTYSQKDISTKTEKSDDSEFDQDLEELVDRMYVPYLRSQDATSSEIRQCKELMLKTLKEALKNVSKEYRLDAARDAIRTAIK